jgi:DNA repair/transcription protein MET18/MMS19
MIKRLVSDLLEKTILPENAIRIIFWEAKALILRLAHTDEILELLLSLLSNTESGLPSARGFGLLLTPDDVLSKENGACVRLLAKQKVFNICIPAIAKKFRNAETAAKPNYLIAISGILKNMPTDIIMPEINTLLPLLLQSLDLQDPSVKAATIQSLTVISQESPEAVEGHISTLVSRLLTSASDPKLSASSVRHNALQCLRIFPGRIKDSTLLPYKNTVTGGLLTVLDDPKRLVRKEAVECRAAWFNMDEPQSD